jgi:hypothetical protein
MSRLGLGLPCMRRILIALVTILVCAAATTGVRLQASTECERWIAEYRDTLAHSPTMQRANAARHRLHRYVHRKVAAATKPQPRILPARYRRPKMSREEALRKMEFACGAFAEDEPALGGLPTSPAPAFIADKGGEDGMPTDMGPAAPASLLAQNSAPTYPSTGSGGFPGGGGGGYPLGGGPSVPLTPGGGGGKGGSETDNPLPPVSPPPAPPTAEAPEPGGMVLMATGLVGVAGMIRRRIGTR